MVKSRVVGQGAPSLPVPRGGTVNRPAAMAVLADWKKAGALQYANWVNSDLPSPFTHLPAFRLPLLFCNVRVSPLKPNQIPTTAPAGSVGTTGAAAGLVPLSMTSGLYTDSWPVAGSTMVPCTNAAWAVFASWQAPF